MSSKYNNPVIKEYVANAPLSEKPLLMDEPVKFNGRKYYGVVTVKYCIGDPWSEEGRSIMEGRFGLIKSMDAKAGDSFLPCAENHCDRNLHYPILQYCDGTVKSLTMIHQTSKGEHIEQVTGLHSKNGGTYQHTWFWVLLNPVLYTNHKA